MRQSNHYTMQDLNSIINQIDKFSNDRDWNQFHSPKNLAASICIEASELLECLQWDNPSLEEVKTREELQANLKDELADVLIYALRFCSKMEFNPIEIIERKLLINREKYPVEKSFGSSKKYDSM